MLAWVHSLIIASAVVLLAGTFRGRQTITTYVDLLRTRETLRETVNNLEEQNKQLEFEIHKIKSSPMYAKKVLRDKYHVTEENETIIFFGD